MPANQYGFEPVGWMKQSNTPKTPVYKCLRCNHLCPSDELNAHSQSHSQDTVTQNSNWQKCKHVGCYYYGTGKGKSRHEGTTHPSQEYSRVRFYPMLCNGTNAGLQPPPDSMFPAVGWVTRRSNHRGVRTPLYRCSVSSCYVIDTHDELVQHHNTVHPNAGRQ